MMKSVLAASVALASLSVGTAHASGTDEFTLQPMGAVNSSTVSYSNETYDSTTTYVQPMVDVNTSTAYGSGTMQSDGMQYDTMQSDTVQYDTMQYDTMQGDSMDSDGMAEPETVDINDYLVPESNN